MFSNLSKLSEVSLELRSWASMIGDFFRVLANQKQGKLRSPGILLGDISIISSIWSIGISIC